MVLERAKVGGMTQLVFGWSLVREAVLEGNNSIYTDDSKSYARVGVGLIIGALLNTPLNLLLDLIRWAVIRPLSWSWETFQTFGGEVMHVVGLGIVLVMGYGVKLVSTLTPETMLVASFWVCLACFALLLFGEWICEHQVLYRWQPLKSPEDEFAYAADPVRVTPGFYAASVYAFTIMFMVVASHPELADSNGHIRFFALMLGWMILLVPVFMAYDCFGIFLEARIKSDFKKLKALVAIRQRAKGAPRTVYYHARDHIREALIRRQTWQLKDPSSPQHQFVRLPIESEFGSYEPSPFTFCFGYTIERVQTLRQCEGHSRGYLGSEGQVYDTNYTDHEEFWILRKGEKVAQVFFLKDPDAEPRDLEKEYLLDLVRGKHLVMFGTEKEREA
jgi:hypothetical protein